MKAEKRKKEDEKRKRQQILSSQFANTIQGHMGRNYIIPQKSDKADKFGNIVQVANIFSCRTFLIFPVSQKFFNPRM